MPRIQLVREPDRTRCSVPDAMSLTRASPEATSSGPATTTSLVPAFPAALNCLEMLLPSISMTVLTPCALRLSAHARAAGASEAE